MRIMLISVFCLIMVGCAASMRELRAISSGKTGCPANEITIEDSRVGMKKPHPGPQNMEGKPIFVQMMTC